MLHSCYTLFRFVLQFAPWNNWLDFQPPLWPKSMLIGNYRKWLISRYLIISRHLSRGVRYLNFQYWYSGNWLSSWLSELSILNLSLLSHSLTLTAPLWLLLYRRKTALCLTRLWVKASLLKESWSPKVLVYRAVNKHLVWHIPTPENTQILRISFQDLYFT